MFLTQRIDLGKGLSILRPKHQKTKGLSLRWEKKIVFNLPVSK